MYLGRFWGELPFLAVCQIGKGGEAAGVLASGFQGGGFHGGGETVLPMNPATTEAVAFLAHPAATTRRRA